MLRYAISDRHQFAGDEQTQRSFLLRQARQLAAEGVDYLQIREKDLEVEALVELALALKAEVAHTGLRLVLNGPRRSAERTGMLWHRTSTEPDTAPAFSASCHSLHEVIAARGRAKVALFGPVFEKAVAAQAGVGLDALAAAVRAAEPMPVLALGGVTEANTAACVAAGAAGVASIRLFLR